ncbi:unnamed protein product [Tuber aestivum]|uniref:Uncharacterized protein n=1 Tax=Tuber aestivum TaxID=59557 RepID=A0A292PXT6_9PEZI|nr:unnamed protein product [Tuber aestivum]
MSPGGLYVGIGVYLLGAYGSATEARIPSWMVLIWLVAISILVPGASILGHFCGLISTLDLVLQHVTFYIFLENRIEMNQIELLPTSVGSRTQ